ncbi:hypothetical protein ACIBHX_51110 [Nonomuraea sp. NPDC050536]|uniref:hypothetical protein n=1 Tax=Nonomuraea sp. NPDC050536 TaxID=3364366 RepID=UPI0037C6764C
MGYPGGLAPSISQLEALSRVLSTQRTLLVLDNCEHLLHACASLADRLAVRLFPGARPCTR